MTTTEQETDQHDLELMLFVIVTVAAILLGYRNREKIKQWFDDTIGNSQ